jgi:acetoin utilization deacetylase AcuC-like enzyme
MRVTEAGFAGMTRVLYQLSQEFCPGKVVMTLEGGYNPEAQARSVVAVLSALLGDDSAEGLLAKARENEPPNVLARCQQAAGRYWKLGLNLRRPAL